MRQLFKRVKLGSIAKFSQGIQVPIGKQEITPKPETHIRFIRIVDYTQQTKDIRYVRNPGNRYIVDESDLVMVRYGAIGVIGTGIRGAIANNMFKVTPTCSDIDKKFLYNCLRSKETKDKLTASNSSTTMPAITFAMAADIEIPLPDLPTQKKIAGILSAYDDLIENNLRRIQILEEMAQSLYREWFVHFRFPGSPAVASAKEEGHESTKLKDSPLGPIPLDWEVKKLGIIYKTSSGGTPSRKKPEFYEDGDIEWIKTKELKDGFILGSEEKINASGLTGSSAKLFPKDTVLIALYGATIGKLGILTKDSATNQACCAFLNTNQPYGRAFAFLTLTQRREDIIGLRLGAAQQNISQAILREFEVVCPNETLLEKFNATIEPQFDLLLNLQRRNHSLRRTRDLLLPKLLSGN